MLPTSPFIEDSSSSSDSTEARRASGTVQAVALENPVLRRLRFANRSNALDIAAVDAVRRGVSLKAILVGHDAQAGAGLEQLARLQQEIRPGGPPDGVLADCKSFV